MSESNPGEQILLGVFCVECAIGRVLQSPKIGIGGRVTPPPLPPYMRSAYGGSADQARTARSWAEVRALQSSHSAKQWPRRASLRCATGREDYRRFAPPGPCSPSVCEVREIAFVPASIASTPL